MYESFFQFRGRPFSAAPQVDLFVGVGSVEQARQTLVRCVERAEGPALLVGPAGTGKTLLCHLLARQFRDRFKVALLTSGRLATRRALLQAILFELGLPYRDLEEGELRLSLIDHLAPGPACPNGLVLVIDEAHTLPLRLLEELRLITNLVQQGEPRVRLVLAGGAALEERFASPKLESFHQRLAARCYLDSLTRDDTIALVRGQIASVGGDCDAIFTDDALRAVHQASDGIPRLVNQVCDHALMLGFVGGQRPIDAAGIEEAWADLQQLPSPWANAKTIVAAAPAPGTTTGIVEFGQLDAIESPELAPVTQPDPLTQLDSIEYQLAQVGDHVFETPTAAAPPRGDEFQPEPQGGPEVVIDFRAARDPFAEDFDEEEVVLDRYASLDSGVLAHRPYVASEEGRKLAQIFPETAPRPKLNVVRETPQPTPPTLSETIHAARPRIVDEADEVNEFGDDEDVDVVYPPERTLRVRESQAAVATLPTASPVGRDSPLIEDGDDSDIIVVDDGEEMQSPSTPTAQATPPRAQRQEYRNLFSRLRKE